MNFNYTTGIPATNNNPSDDQPDMDINTNSAAAIWEIDHFGFVNAMGGWHKVIRMPQIVGNTDPAPVISPTPAGQIYTRTVNGDLQLFYESSGGVVNQITNGSTLTRAAVNFTVTAGSPLPVITLNTAYNIDDVVALPVSATVPFGTVIVTFITPISTPFYYTSISAVNVFNDPSPNSQTYGGITQIPTVDSIIISFVNSAGAPVFPQQASVLITL
jgi:hypothetical protein